MSISDIVDKTLDATTTSVAGVLLHVLGGIQGFITSDDKERDLSTNCEQLSDIEDGI